MPKWIHDRADHIREKNPSMPESEAFAIATQQSHAIGKSPKGYGTVKGKLEAKAKYDTPEDDKKTASRFIRKAAIELIDNADKPISNVIQEKILGRTMNGKEVSKEAALFVAAYNEFKEKRAFQTSQYSTPIEGPKVARQASSQPGLSRPPLGRVLEKAAFTQSQYGSTGGFVDFHQVSSQPGFKRPRLDRAIQKEGDFIRDKAKEAGAITPTGLTPAARLSSSMRIGMPKVTNPSGPSIASIAKPVGFGKPAAGATLGP